MLWTDQQTDVINLTIDSRYTLDTIHLIWMECHNQGMS